MLALQYPPVLLLLLPLLSLLWLRRLPTRYLNIPRALLYLALVLAVAQPVVRLRMGGGTVVVVADRSASLPADALSRQEALISGIQGRRKADDKIGVVSFARRAFIEHPPQNVDFSGFSAVHDPDFSNLAEGISAALAVIPEGTPGRIVVLGDGGFSGANSLDVAGLAAARGIGIDYRLIARPAGLDLSIARLEAPNTLRPGEALMVAAHLDSPAEQEVSYTLERGSVIVASGSGKFPRGVTPLILRDLPGVAEGEGAVLGYRLIVKGERDDPVPENNTARFLVRVERDMPLLYVSGTAGSGLFDMLRGSGVEVERVAAGSAGGLLHSPLGYSGVVIENVRADQIGESALRNLAEWVLHSGAGLLVTGGQNSFGMGGYYRSELERVLPVSLELRREHRSFSMAIVVALDRSGSMSMPTGDGRRKMDLANIGAVEVLRLLSDYDEIGVIAVDTAPHVVVPRVSATRARSMEDRILGIESMGGGIYVYEALKASLKELRGSDAGVKHIVLFADAADAEEPGEYRALVEAAVKTGVTVSVIGLGTRADVDAELLQDIAQVGGGRCFFSDNAHELPRLFAQDTFMVARNTWVTNSVSPRFTVGLAEIAPTLPPRAPLLGGYNLSYLKPGATVAALSADENEAPLLAMHRQGIGRVAAWMGEADGPGAGAFAKWERAGEFYGALARYVSGPSARGREGVVEKVATASGGVRVEVHIDPERPELRALDGAELHVLRHRPGRPARGDKMPFVWRDPTTLAATLELSGNETLLSTVVYPDGSAVTLPPVRLPYSPEFDPDSFGKGAETLAAIARSTGGNAPADLGEVWGYMRRGKVSLNLAPFLYLLASALLLFEVLERRTSWFSARRHSGLNGDAPMGATARGREASLAAVEEQREADHSEPRKESALSAAKRRAARRTGRR